jgi:hypothetical protein
VTTLLWPQRAIARNRRPGPRSDLLADRCSHRQSARQAMNDDGLGFPPSVDTSPYKAMIAKHVYREFALRLPPCGRGSPAPYLDARRTTTYDDVCRPYNLMIIRSYSAPCSHAEMSISSARIPMHRPACSLTACSTSSGITAYLSAISVEIGSADSVRPTCAPSDAAGRAQTSQFRRGMLTRHAVGEPGAGEQLRESSGTRDLGRGPGAHASRT